MKAIFTADIHLKLWSDRDFNESGLPMKLIEIISAIKQMAEYATKHNIPMIIIGGDLNDTKGIVSVRAFVLFRKIVEEFTNIQWVILHGNHDATQGTDTQEHSAIQLLEGYSNVQVIMDPEVLEFGDRKVLFMPHHKTIIASLEYCIENHNCDILVSHFGLDEAQLSSGISLRAGIRCNDLRSFKLVLLGHYHKPQEINTETTNIYYAGSLVPIRRDEASEEKRFLVVDTDTLEVVSVPTSGYRRYIELELDTDTDTDELISQIEKAKADGHHVVIKKRVAEIPLDLKTLSETVQVVDVFEKDITLRGITSNMDVADQLKKYLEVMGIVESECEEYLKIGVHLITCDDGSIPR